MTLRDLDFRELFALARRELAETTRPLTSVRDLMGLLNTMGEGDELVVLGMLIERLRVGRERYGPLNVASGRLWPREKLDESLDRALYAAFEDLREVRAAEAVVETEQGTVAAHFTVGRDGSVTQHEQPGLWAEVNAFAFEAQDTSVWLHLPCGRLWVLLRKEPLRCRACEAEGEGDA